jgi:diguanylate cyclase (GGDEF)-like protein
MRTVRAALRRADRRLRATPEKIGGPFFAPRGVTGRGLAADRIAHRATHDELTGLPNRLSIRRHVQALLDAEPEDGTLAVMFVDLDGLKRINQSLGHAAGDAVLSAAARRLSEALGPAGMVARFGGDEFIVAAQCRGGCPQAAALAQSLRAALEGGFDVGGQQVFIGASVGIAMVPEGGRTQEALYQNANTALHRAKAAERGQCRFFEAGMADEAKARMALEAALRHALERGEFDIHYQPQVDLRTGRVVGLEALLRWHHPVWGDVAPARFIPVAEETGLIVAIGSWVLRTACRQAALWRAAGMGGLRIAVNLSACQFAQPSLVQTVAQALAESGLAPGLLDLELTESMVMNDLGRTMDVLARLKDLGLTLSVDDFGTGYSSLAYLKRFPVDMLKIDRSFVRGISCDSHDAAISDAIIAMAHRLGIRVIAEGVETEAQCAALAGRMCDEIQGYLFSPALPADDVARLIRAGRTLPAHLGIP